MFFNFSSAKSFGRSEKHWDFSDIFLLHLVSYFTIQKHLHCKHQALECNISWMQALVFRTFPTSRHQLHIGSFHVDFIHDTAWMPTATGSPWVSKEAESLQGLTLWIQFAANDNPKGSGGPKWPTGIFLEGRPMVTKILGFVSNDLS